MNSTSRFAQWLLPSAVVSSGRGNLNLTRLPQDAGKLGPKLDPEVLPSLIGLVATVSSVLDFVLRGAFDLERFNRSKEYTVNESDPPGDVRFFKSSSSTWINAINR